jgi:uncharacterized protein YqeY
MNMNSREQLKNDLKAAMIAKDAFKRDILRGLMAAIKQVEVDEQITLDEAGIQALLTKQAKQRRESIHDAEEAGRPEMVENEQAELEIIEAYLPQMMSREEVETIVAGIVADLGATNPKDMGRVMGKVMPILKGKADGRIVNEVVRQSLAG